MHSKTLSGSRNIGNSWRICLVNVLLVGSPLSHPVSRTLLDLLPSSVNCKVYIARKLNYDNIISRSSFLPVPSL